MSGYSGTPLAKKLGIKDGYAVFVSGAPQNYRDLVEPLPPAVRCVTRADRGTDLVHLFVTKRADLARSLQSYRKSLRPEAAIWVSWPKKASTGPTEVTEDVLRDVALRLGFVDVKVCAVDETWSGLKLTVRVENRRAAR